MSGRLYSGWDIGKCEPYTISHNDVEYYLKPVISTIVDHYDPYLGSAELSHHINKGFSKIVGYKGDTEELDFSFARPQDEIKMVLDEKIGSIKLNAANMRYAKINSQASIDYSINIDIDPIDFGISLKKFINNNKATIKDIKFSGNNNIYDLIIEKICSKEGIDFSNNNKKEKNM